MPFCLRITSDTESDACFQGYRRPFFCAGSLVLGASDNPRRYFGETPLWGGVSLTKLRTDMPELVTLEDAFKRGWSSRTRQRRMDLLDKLVE